MGGIEECLTMFFKAKGHHQLAKGKCLKAAIGTLNFGGSTYHIWGKEEQQRIQDCVLCKLGLLLSLQGFWKKLPKQLGELLRVKYTNLNRE